MERPAGVTLLSILAFGSAVILGLGGLLLCLGGAMLTRMSSMGLDRPRMALFAGRGGAIIGVFMLGFAALYVMMGTGLWKVQNWARIVTIVFAGLGVLLSGMQMLEAIAPFHVFLFFWRAIFLALDVWIVVYLLQPNVKQAFAATGF